MKIVEIRVFPDDQATGLWDQNTHLIPLSSLNLTEELIEDLINMQLIYNKQDFYTMSDEDIEEYSLYFSDFSKRIAYKLKTLFPDVKISYYDNSGQLVSC